MLLVPRLVRIVSLTFYRFLHKSEGNSTFLEYQTQSSVINDSNYIFDM